MVTDSKGSSTLRAAYISQAPHIHGAERSLQAMLLSIQEFGVEPLVVCPPGDQMIPWCRQHSISTAVAQLHARDKWKPFRWLSSVRSACKLLKKHKINIIHANQFSSYPAAGVAGRSLGIPRVCHMRNELSAGDLTWWCSAGAEGIVCISKYIEQRVLETWPTRIQKPRLRTILNPVRMPSLGTPDLQDALRDAARHRWGIGKESRVFGFIGQLIPEKGLAELIQAVAALPDAADWVLLIGGQDPHRGTPYERRCRQIVAELSLGKQVKFLGYLDSVEEFYRAVDVAVVPSSIEPLGRIPLEAAAFSRPSIAYSVGGLSETIRHGETGWLVPPGDESGLRKALRHALSSPLEGVGRDARAWVEVACDPGRYAASMSEFYRELITDRATLCLNT